MSTKVKIQDALKELGYNSRKVSVSVEKGTDQYVTLTIRDKEVNYAAVKALAKSFNRVDRCEASYEILCGGNVYVDVWYLCSVMAEMAAPYLEPVRATLAALEAVEENVGLKVNERFIIFKGWKDVNLYDRETKETVNNFYASRADCIAFAIARRSL